MTETEFKRYLALGLCAPGVWGGQKEATMYSYNGVVLPKLPEWDKETYPYVCICLLSGAYYLALLTDIRTCDESNLIAGASGSTYAVSGESWSKANVVQAMTPKTPIWSNFDVYYTDDVADVGGTLFLAKSEPIPVYE